MRMTTVHENTAHLSFVLSVSPNCRRRHHFEDVITVLPNSSKHSSLDMLEATRNDTTPVITQISETVSTGVSQQRYIRFSSLFRRLTFSEWYIVVDSNPL